MLRLSLVVLFFTIAALGQDTSTKAPHPAAPTKGAFSSAQRTSAAMRSVEVVIADSEAFQQERDRLQAARSNLQKANPSVAEHSKLTLRSPFERSILFELGDAGVISKVVVRVELAAGSKTACFI